MSQNKPPKDSRRIQTSALDEEKIEGINLQLHRIQQIKSAKLRRSDQPKKEDLEELPLETVDSMIGFATQGDLYRNDLDLIFDRITGEADAPVYEAPERPVETPEAALEDLPSAPLTSDKTPKAAASTGEHGFEFVPSEQAASGGFEFDMSAMGGGLDDGSFDLENLELDLSFMTPNSGEEAAAEGGFEFSAGEPLEPTSVDPNAGSGGFEFNASEPAAPTSPEKSAPGLIERVVTPSPEILGGYSLKELEALERQPLPERQPQRHSFDVDRTAPSGLEERPSDELNALNAQSEPVQSEPVQSEPVSAVEVEGGSFEPFDFNNLTPMDEQAHVEVVIDDDDDDDDIELSALEGLMDIDVSPEPTPSSNTQASNTQASNTQASNTQASNTQAQQPSGPLTPERTLSSFDVPDTWSSDED